jgi:hypothetical protein
VPVPPLEDPDPPLETVCEAEPLPLQLSTATTCRFMEPRFMPSFDQASKWFWTVMVPLVRGEFRIEMYCQKVYRPEPAMAGWLTC